MPRRLLLVACAVTLLHAPTAAAAVVDRAQVGIPGRSSPTRGFSENLSVALTAPAGYERACCADFVSGAWEGPRAQASDGSTQNLSRIDWSVKNVRNRRSAAALARAAGWRDYPEARGRKRRVRHVVGGRTVGTLAAFSAVDAEPAPGARVQAALAVTLGHRVHTVALFDLPDPFADTSSAGALTVQGRPASAWNRAQADAALDGVYVEGNLPPARVTARRSAGRISGRVADGFGHPVAQVRLVLQRRVGGRWRQVATGATDIRGRYSLAARGSGPRRVVATQAGTSARSRPVR